MRCWSNRMKHACPQTTKWRKKHPECSNEVKSQCGSEYAVFVRGNAKEFKKPGGIYKFDETLIVPYQQADK